MSTSHRFHLIGIGGAGMSVVAELLNERGMVVSGSDQNDSPILDHLRQAGIEVFVGHDASHVPSDGVVVVSTAVRENNPELAQARLLGLTVIHRSQALALAAAGMRFVAVAGAHGKTTTSGMLSMALREAGADPSIAVGSIIPEIGSGAHLGTGDIFVAEADESDGSFLNYTPWIEIVTNVEPDHLDRYESREAFEQVFVDFVGCLREGGTLVCCGEDSGSARLARYAQEHGIDTVTYARVGEESPECTVVDVVIEDARTDGHTSCATLHWGDLNVEITLRVPGLHNVLNAVAAWISGVRLGIDPQLMARSLAAFTGTSRRFEFKGEVQGRRLFDDYAHHPTEVAAAIAQARTAAAGGDVSVVFQPHLYSRTRSFAERFADALSGADRVYVCDIYGAREDPVPGVDSTLITSHLSKAHYVPDMHEAAREAARGVGEGGILLTMGAGSITQCSSDVLDEWTRVEDAQ